MRHTTILTSTNLFASSRIWPKGQARGSRRVLTIQKGQLGQVTELKSKCRSGSQSMRESQWLRSGLRANYSLLLRRMRYTIQWWLSRTYPTQPCRVFGAHSGLSVFGCPSMECNESELITLASNDRHELTF
jgi:hypothetical protein